ncbi:hypothetical protein BH10ACT11_BH10ACT11_04600 [soil metagenome]
MLAGLVLALLLVAVAGANIRPSHNPANDHRLINKHLEDYHYDYAKHCKDHTPKGMKLLQRWLEHHVRGESWGIYRCEKLSPGNYSLHSESRAIDWHLERSNHEDRKAAMQLIRTLLGSDKHGNHAALARRMGIQGIIFDCHAWWSGPGEMEKYSYCYKANGHKRHHLDPTAAHMNHVHLELNKKGARAKTSFWGSPLGH